MWYVTVWLFAGVFCTCAVSTPVFDGKFLKNWTDSKTGEYHTCLLHCVVLHYNVFSLRWSCLTENTLGLQNLCRGWEHDDDVDQLSVIKFIQRVQTSSLNAIGGTTRQGASCPCGGGSSRAYVLRFDLKDEIVLHWRSSCSNRFQTCGPATEKRRRPSEVSVWGTVNKSMLDERRARSGVYGFNMLFR